MSDLEYKSSLAAKDDLAAKSSLAATAQLTKAIFDQESFLNIDQETQEKIMKEVKHKKSGGSSLTNKSSTMQSASATTTP